jgi:chemotaxis signal transduction protein
MADSQNQIKCLILPLEGGSLVVPNAAVAEVLQSQPLREPAESAPTWVCGTLQWQDSPELPVVAFEMLCGQEPSVETEHRHDASVVVLHALAGLPKVHHYGVRISGVPSFEFIDTANLAAADDQSANCDFVASRVYVKGVTAFIPDLEEIEAAVATLL